MTYSDFDARWKPTGGAERANYSLFLQDLCDLIGAPHPDPTTDNPAQDAYVLERAVEFNDGTKRSTGRPSVGRIDLNKRGCFILETKQGSDTPDQQKKAELTELSLAPEKRRKGHAVRSSPKWGQMMQAARKQALGYVRALPAGPPRTLPAVCAGGRRGVLHRRVQQLCRYRRFVRALPRPDPLPVAAVGTAVALLRQTADGAYAV